MFHDDFDNDTHFFSTYDDLLIVCLIMSGSHLLSHFQDPFECSLCPMVADSSEMLQEHMIQHCKVRTYACKFCPQSFNHKSTLRAHMRAHNDTDPFLCDLCEFESASPLEYRAHMQVWKLPGDLKENAWHGYTPCGCFPSTEI